jgi:hypothetical protein
VNGHRGIQSARIRQYALRLCHRSGASSYRLSAVILHDYKSRVHKYAIGFDPFYASDLQKAY